MAVWYPALSLKVNGSSTPLDGYLDGLAVEYGKTAPFERIRAPYASFDIIGNSFPNLFDEIQILLEDSTGTPIPIFSGFITDITIKAVNATDAQASVNAVGYSARIAGALAGANGYPAETEKERIAKILGDALDTTTIDNDSGLINDTSGTIDDPENRILFSGTGRADLPAYSDGPVNAWDYAQTLAEQAFEFIIENPDGTFDYSPAVFGGITVDSSVAALKSNLQLVFDSSLVVNDLTIGNLQDERTASISAYGRRSKKLDTSLDDIYVTPYLNDYLNSYDAPFPRMSGITLVMSELTDTQRDVFISAKYGRRFTLSNLPTYLTTLSGSYAVLGWRFTLSYGQALIALYATDREVF